MPEEPEITPATVVVSDDDAPAIFLPPFFLNAGVSDVLTADQARQVQEIAGLMSEQEDAYLIMTAYQVLTQQGKGQAVFEGIRQAEAVAKALKAQGVSDERIFARGLLSEAAPDTTCGIDFSFYLPEGQAETTDLPVVGLRYANAVPRHPVHERLLYKVQVGALSGAYGTNVLDKYDSIMVERQMDQPYYRYTIGAFTTYAEAEAFKQELLDSGAFGSAYVVAYIDGRRADQMRARRHIIDFPDLKGYAD